jgi:hypothetical protein
MTFPYADISKWTVGLNQITIVMAYPNMPGVFFDQSFMTNQGAGIAAILTDYSRAK